MLTPPSPLVLDAAPDGTMRRGPEPPGYHRASSTFATYQSKKRWTPSATLVCGS